MHCLSTECAGFFRDTMTQNDLVCTGNSVPEMALPHTTLLGANSIDMPDSKKAGTETLG